MHVNNKQRKLERCVKAEENGFLENARRRAASISTNTKYKCKHEIGKNSLLQGTIMV